MRREGKQYKNKGFTRIELFEVILIMAVVASVLVPVVVSSRPNQEIAACQANLKELTMALQMYWNDYDAVLPSSYFHQPKGANAWDPVASAEYCGKYGVTPPKPDIAYQDIGYVQVLWPHIRNKSAFWCPLDPNAGERGSSRFRITPKPTDLVSYIYKPAADRAWFGIPGSDGIVPIRKEGEFEYVADQVIFFERCGWHWGGQNKGWKNGISMNVAYMDGHVTAIRLVNAVGVKSFRSVEGFTNVISMPGEPLWYNYDANSQTTATDVLYDPRIHYDKFP